MDSKYDLNGIKSSVTEVSEDLLNKVFSEIDKVLDESHEVFSDITPIIEFIRERSFTTSLLLKSDKIWDAEIIFRSILEALSKFLFIIVQPTQDLYNQKAEEFWIHLSNNELLRQSKETVRLVNAGGVSDLDRFKSMILSDNEMAELEAGYAWQNRTRLKSDWAFNTIIEQYLLKDKDLAPFISFNVMHFFYKMASHTSHADKVGLAYIGGRNTMDELKEHDDLSHYLKIMKNVTNFSLWILSELARKLDDKIKKQLIYDDFLKYNNYVTPLHQLVLDESHEIEDKLNQK